MAKKKPEKAEQVKYKLGPMFMSSYVVLDSSGNIIDQSNSMNWREREDLIKYIVHVQRDNGEEIDFDCGFEFVSNSNEITVYFDNEVLDGAGWLWLQSQDKKRNLTLPKRIMSLTEVR